MQTTVLVSGIYTRSKRKHKSYLPDVTHAAIGAEGWENRRVINTPLTSQCLSRVRRAVTELAWQRGGAQVGMQPSVVTQAVMKLAGEEKAVMQLLLGNSIRSALFAACTSSNLL